MKIQIEDIISDIQHESCVLVLGPDIIDFDNKPFFEKLCRELTDDPNMSQIVDLPQHIFMQDEMFQLQPGARDSQLQRFLVNFYKKQDEFNEPFAKIAQIKFHAILSLFPDKRLPAIFDQLNYPYQFGYYSKDEVPKPVEKPGIDNPLIYNMMGNFEEQEYVITFSHLFRYLSGIMGKNELPQTLVETIKKARSFIFLGVQFERWYIQLLLNMIVGTKEKQDKLSLLKSSQPTELRSFVTRRFDLNFLDEEPMDFLQLIYDKCSEKGLLKKTIAKTIATVYISYCPEDAAVAEKIHALFTEHSILCIMSEQDIKGVERITGVTEKLKTADCVVSIVSENSLLSPWVGLETHLTLNNPGIHFIPCYTDESFMDRNLTARVGKHIDKKIKEINEQILVAEKDSGDDLSIEKKQLENYWKYFTDNLNNIIQRKCINLMPDEVENNMGQVISAVKVFLNKSKK